MGKTRGRKDRDNACDETKLYLQEPCLERKIPETELLSITEVPEGLDVNEWLALHTIGFFEHVNLIYGTISEFCTLSSCPDMVGPGPRQYMWMDDKGKKSRLSSPQYVDYVMTFVQKTANDEAIFPTKHGHDFPPNFDQIIKKIHRLLFHVIAHIYHAHFREVVLLGLHAHLNSLFAHLIEFNIHYHTIEDKETEVLQDLIHALRLLPTSNNNSSEEEVREGPDTTDLAVVAAMDSEEGDTDPDRVSQADCRTGGRSPTNLEPQPMDTDTASIEPASDAEASTTAGKSPSPTAEVVDMDTGPDTPLIQASACADGVADTNNEHQQDKEEEEEEPVVSQPAEKGEAEENSSSTADLSVKLPAEQSAEETAAASDETGEGRAKEQDNEKKEEAEQQAPSIVEV